MSTPSPSALFDLTGKVAIVTGSTKGIGRAMVEGLAAAGASVVVSSRKQDLCDTVAKEVLAVAMTEGEPTGDVRREPDLGLAFAVERVG